MKPWARSPAGDRSAGVPQIQTQDDDHPAGHVAGSLSLNSTGLHVAWAVILAAAAGWLAPSAPGPAPKRSPSRRGRHGDAEHAWRRAFLGRFVCPCQTFLGQAFQADSSALPDQIPAACTTAACAARSLPLIGEIKEWLRSVSSSKKKMSLG